MSIQFDKEKKLDQGKWKYHFEPVVSPANLDPGLVEKSRCIILFLLEKKEFLELLYDKLEMYDIENTIQRLEEHSGLTVDFLIKEESTENQEAMVNVLFGDIVMLRSKKPLHFTQDMKDEARHSLIQLLFHLVEKWTLALNDILSKPNVSLSEAFNEIKTKGILHIKPCFGKFGMSVEGMPLAFSIEKVTKKIKSDINNSILKFMTTLLEKHCPTYRNMTTFSCQEKVSNNNILQSHDDNEKKEEEKEETKEEEEEEEEFFKVNHQLIFSNNKRKWDSDNSMENQEKSSLFQIKKEKLNHVDATWKGCLTIGAIDGKDYNLMVTGKDVSHHNNGTWIKNLPPVIVQEKFQSIPRLGDLKTTDMFLFEKSLNNQHCIAILEFQLEEIGQNRLTLEVNRRAFYDTLMNHAIKKKVMYFKPTEDVRMYIIPPGIDSKGRFWKWSSYLSEKQCSSHLIYGVVVFPSIGLQTPFVPKEILERMNEFISKLSNPPEKMLNETIQFITATNGAEEEQKWRRKLRKNYHFLLPTDPYHGYFIEKVTLLKKK